MTEPLVSVVVPVHDGERYLAETLRSVFAQDYPHMEVLVIDDGSTDRSVAIAKTFPELTLIEQAQRGVAAARNLGIERSRGEYVAFIDQDDLWMPEKLRLQVDCLVADARLQIVIAQQRLFLERGCARPSWLREGLLDKDFPGYLPGTLLVRRSVFDHVGLFREGYEFASDSDWFFRARDGGLAVRVLPELLLRKRIHDGNESSNAPAIQGEILRLVHESIRRKRSVNAKEGL